MDITKALERLKSVDLRGGIFGKTTMLLIVLSICVTAVCVVTKLWWIALILMIPLMGMVFYALKRCFDFAEKNPQAAIMEGAEFLVHEKLMFGQKDKSEGNPMLETTEYDHEPPVLDVELVRQPDPSPDRAIPENSNLRKEEE